MKKVILLATVPSMIGLFNMDNIKVLTELGFEVHVACNFFDTSVWNQEITKEFKNSLKKKNIICHQISIERSPLKLRKNYIAFRQVLEVLNEEQFSFIHCHTPVGGIIGRLAGAKTRTKVIYTAHGFHFYQGAPFKNWLIYYPVEWLCSWLTDVLITINKEDYKLAKEKMRARRIEYIPGVGIDLNQYSREISDTALKRKELNIPDKAIWILAVGELTDRKNHEVLIRAVAAVEKIYLTIAGKGNRYGYLLNLITELGVSDRVNLLGYRTDVLDLCRSCDIFAFPSRQEGMPVALMESMASGKPVICSRVRGNTDLIDEKKGGFFFDPTDSQDVVNAIEKIRSRNWSAMGEHNREKIKRFDSGKVMKRTEKIYQSLKNSYK